MNTTDTKNVYITVLIMPSIFFQDLGGLMVNGQYGLRQSAEGEPRSLKLR